MCALARTRRDDPGLAVAELTKALPTQVPCVFYKAAYDQCHYLRVGSIHPDGRFYLLFLFGDEDWANDDGGYFTHVHCNPVFNGGISVDPKKFTWDEFGTFFNEIYGATKDVFDKEQIVSILEVLTHKRWGIKPTKQMINKLLWLFNGDIDA